MKYTIEFTAKINGQYVRKTSRFISKAKTRSEVIGRWLRQMPRSWDLTVDKVTADLRPNVLKLGRAMRTIELDDRCADSRCCGDCCECPISENCKSEPTE